MKLLDRLFEICVFSMFALVLAFALFLILENIDLAFDAVLTLVSIWLISGIIAAIRYFLTPKSPGKD